MDASFVFEAPSDEEPEYDLESEVDEENEEDDKKKSKKSQSPWDFSAYSESVADEHNRRNTTSIDDKISRVRLQRSLSLPNVDDDDDSDVEPHKQEAYKHEDDDEEPNGVALNPSSFFSSAEGVVYHAKSFMELNLSRPLLRACEALGYTKPTPIQAACIPQALAGRDICGSAITGSGKTAAFTLPTLERLLFRPKHVSAIRVLILTPTRELAAQIHSMITNLAQFTDIRCCVVVGGMSSKEQEVSLRSMPDIVVATPGRIIDHLLNSMSVDLDSLAVLILDEADRLLELGFSAEIHELMRLCPKRRQTMLFSATMTEQVNDLVQLSLTKPLRLQADPNSKRPATLTEEVVRVRRNREAHQEAVLLALCSKTFTSKVIVFCGTKVAAHRLKILFGLVGFKASELHGNLTQVQRLDALELFRKQEVDFLLATDVAARGLDIVGVQTVINFACPRDLKTYVHRVGRTARAGREGYAVTFATDNDRSLLKAITKRAGSNLKSRTVAEQSINKWVQSIDQMEDQVSEILQEEMEEKALRKAEMEASKAENMIEHKDEIFSRPKRTWFVTEREKQAMAKIARESLGKGDLSVNEVISAQQAEDLKMKEKRKREREKRLPQKKRKRLEAARETLEVEDDDDDDGTNNSEGKKKGKKDKKPITLVDLAHGRAKAIKARMRAEDAGKVGKARPQMTANKKTKPSSQPRADEMRELFESDMSSGNKHLQRNPKAGVMKKSNKSFKSKSRYKRR